MRHESSCHVFGFWFKLDSNEMNEENQNPEGQEKSSLSSSSSSKEIKPEELKIICDFTSERMKVIKSSKDITPLFPPCNKRGPRLTLKERSVLLTEIWQMHICSYSTWEMCQRTGLSASVVRHYVLMAERITREQIKSFTHMTVINRFYRGSQERMKRLWELYSLAGGRKEIRNEIGEVVQEFVKANRFEQRKCLEAIAMENDRLVEIGQKLGVIPIQAEKHEVSGPEGTALPMVVLDIPEAKAVATRVVDLKLDSDSVFSIEDKKNGNGSTPTGSH